VGEARQPRLDELLLRLMGGSGISSGHDPPALSLFGSDG